MKKKIIYFGACCMTALFIASCSTKNPDSPGFEYMPDMYRSPSYESNSGNGNFADSMTNRGPVAGTITYEQQVTAYHPYPYPNTDSGYAWAGRNLHDPFPATADVLEHGKLLYTKFCVHCHGATGGGDGLVGAKLPGPPPAYSGALKDLPEGKMFHTLQYGKGNMGSHASQLTPDERWQIVRYVQTLQGKEFDANGLPKMTMVNDTLKKDNKKGTK
jgi:mono/diheme cytochrome c family protein